MSGWASDTDEERQNLHGKAIVRGLRSRSRQRLALYAMALLLVGIVLLLGVVYSEVTQMRTEIVASRQGASSPPPTPSSILSTSERPSTSASDTLSTWESPLSPGLHYCRNNLFLSGGVSDEVAGQTAEARATADAATLKQVQAQEAIYVKWWSHNYQDYRAARKSGKLESDHEKDISQYELAYPRDSPWPCSAPAGQESNAQAGMSRWGQSGDGGKWLCRLPSLAQHGARRAAAAGAGVDACAIFSLGSANDFSFEESMIANTPCRIHTFDCSSNPPPKPLERHTFHSECMGRSVAESVVYNAAGKDAEALKGYVFKQYNTLMQEAGLKFVDLLKMDIEGGELAAFEELLVPENAALPYQISFEQHRFPQSPSYLDNSKVWDALWRAGYRAVAQEPNDFSGCCMEFTWVRVFC